MQRICVAAKQGGENTEATAAMAALGNHGKCKQNVQRDWHRMLKRDLGEFFIEPTWLPIPMAGSDELVEWPILAPHESMAMLQRTGKFQQMFFEGVDLGHFWHNFAKEPDYQTFPQLDGWPGDVFTLVPARVHIDDGRWSGAMHNRAVTIVQFSGFAHAQHALDSRLLVTVLPSTFAKKHGEVNPTNLSLDAIFKFLVWSFFWAWKNIWPSIPFVLRLRV
jgi:hypothetical protein